jgi:hypothetical protein
MNTLVGRLGRLEAETQEPIVFRGIRVLRIGAVNAPKNRRRSFCVYFKRGSNPERISHVMNGTNSMSEAALDQLIELNPART